MMRHFILAICVLAALPGTSQTMTDGLMMPKGDLCTGFFFGQDQWKNYWEGALSRENGNIGTITTQNISWMGVYGLTKKLNVMGMLPYVSTKASAGTMRGLNGIQDLSLGAKYNLLEQPLGPGKFTTFAGAQFSTPLTNYTPDFLPLSIGMASTTAAARLNLNYRMEQGWYINASNAYTWRSNVKLDRTSYYVDNTFYQSSEVKMYDQYDFNIDLGYSKNNLLATVSYMQVNTLGGGDIRRQDMPFVSNQMNVSKIGALVKYDFTKPKNFTARASGAYVINGRNVGQSTSFMVGILYTFHFIKATE